MQLIQDLSIQMLILLSCVFGNHESEKFSFSIMEGDRKEATFYVHQTNKINTGIPQKFLSFELIVAVIC